MHFQRSYSGLPPKLLKAAYLDTMAFGERFQDSTLLLAWKSFFAIQLPGFLNQFADQEDSLLAGLWLCFRELQVETSARKSFRSAHLYTSDW